MWQYQLTNSKETLNTNWQDKMPGSLWPSVCIPLSQWQLLFVTISLARSGLPTRAVAALALSVYLPYSLLLWRSPVSTVQAVSIHWLFAQNTQSYFPWTTTLLSRCMDIHTHPAVTCSYPSQCLLYIHWMDRVLMPSLTSQHGDWLLVRGNTFKAESSSSLNMDG